MDITTNNDWTFVGDDYKVAFATTSDPRVLAVIRNQSDQDGVGGAYIDGDCYAPAFYFERGRKDTAGSTFMDSESERIAEAYSNARDYFVNQHYRHAGRRQMDYSRALERYMRIFWDTTFVEQSSSVIRGMEVTIFNTPTWREHIGWTDEYAATQPEDIRFTTILDGERKEWEGALDGDVFGIGWAVNEARRLDDGEIDYDDFEESIEVWSFIGEDYAKESAARFDGGTPTLQPMLDFAV